MNWQLIDDPQKAEKQNVGSSNDRLFRSGVVYCGVLGWGELFYTVSVVHAFITDGQAFVLHLHPS